MLIPTLIISIFLTDPKLICFITDDDSRSLVLASLAEKMPKLLPDILAAARQIQDAYYRVKVLASLADKLSPELLLDVLTATRQIHDYDSRALVLASLAKKLSQIKKPLLFSYWQDTIKILSVGERLSLFDDIGIYYI